jgi:purine nucleosidase
MMRTITVLLAAACAVAFAPARDGRAQGRQKLPRAPRAVVLTTDCGADLDDQGALAQLALTPELELRGVVTTHAPTPRLPAPAAESSARCVREVLGHLPLRHQPAVLAGSSVPLESKSAPLRNAGVDFILRESRPYSRGRRLALLVIGAGTDVASALLTDPTLVDRVEIISMGFTSWPKGGEEWNVKNDVRAWQVILDSGAEVVVGDGVTTARDLTVTREGARALFESSGDAGRFLAGLHTAWLDSEAALCEGITGSRDAWPVWDQVTVAYLLGLTQSKKFPRPALRDDLRFLHGAASAARGPALKWIISIDSERLWARFVRDLRKAMRNDE